MNVLTKFRWAFGVLLFLTLIAGVVGWFVDKDPTKLEPLIQWMVILTLGLEAGNVGKRATFKKEATNGTHSS